MEYSVKLCYSKKHSTGLSFQKIYKFKGLAGDIPVRPSSVTKFVTPRSEKAQESATMAFKAAERKGARKTGKRSDLALKHPKRYEWKGRPMPFSMVRILTGCQVFGVSLDNGADPYDSLPSSGH
jgi:hypothetical protein